MIRQLTAPVVTVQLPSPRRDDTRFTVQSDVVTEFVEYRLQSDNLAEKTIDQHHVSDDSETFGAQRGLSTNRKANCRTRCDWNSSPYSGVELHELGVRPRLPLDSIDRITDPGAIDVTQLRK